MYINRILCTSRITFFFFLFIDTEMLYLEPNGDLKMHNVLTNVNRTLVNKKMFDSFHSQVLTALIKSEICSSGDVLYL